MKSELIVSYYQFPITIPDFSSRPLSPGENAALQIYFRHQVHKKALRFVSKAERASKEALLSEPELERLEKEIARIAFEFSFDNSKIPESTSLLQQEINQLLIEWYETEPNRFGFPNINVIRQKARARLTAKLSACSPEEIGF